ncbi:hypothetical protein [Haloferula helveola]|uniref:hypothetical protein n=1 Tax=Haloferula helveola TaxID=490095 RepID=UPI0030AF6C41
MKLSLENTDLSFVAFMTTKALAAVVATGEAKKNACSIDATLNGGPCEACQ